MIVYLDTSALVPLMISEPASLACGALWDAADIVVTTRLAYVEASAALTMAERMGRIAPGVQLAAQAVLDELWDGIDVIELDERLMRSAAELARRHGLRGYDAVHCAAALAVDGPELVAATGDERLLGAWVAEGMAVSGTGA